jgi:MFS family permease
MNYRQLLNQNKNIRLLWTGQFVSEIGDWLNNITVLAMTIKFAGEGREGLALAIYAMARHVPLFVFGPVAGVVADRFDRRRLMIAADLARAVFALGFFVASAWNSLLMIYTVGACIFCASSFFNAAKRATIPNLTNNTDELITTNSLTASTTAATIAIGSAIGGIAATFLGRNIVLILNAITFLISAELIRRIVYQSKRHAVAQSRRLTVFSDFRDGLSYVKNINLLSAIFIVAAGWGLGNGAARATYSLFGSRFGEARMKGFVDKPSEFGISVLFVAMGLGGVLGAPLARRFSSVGKEKLERRMIRSIILDGCGLAIFSFAPSLWLASFVLILREMNYAIWWTAQQTIMMSNADDKFAGRVFASFETLTTLTMVGSMLLCGAAADKYGIEPVALVGGIIITLSAFSWFLFRKKVTD